MVLRGGERTETEIEGGAEAERSHPWWWWVAIVGKRSDCDGKWTLKKKARLEERKRER